MARKLIALIFVIFSVPSIFAQEVTEGVDLNSTSEKTRTIDKKFVIVSIALFSSAVYDTETTFACVNSGRCREANPVAAPFINSGRPATYGFLAGTSSGMLYFGYRLKKSDNPALRKVWWLPPVMSIVAHGATGSLNLRFVF